MKKVNTIITIIIMLAIMAGCSISTNAASTGGISYKTSKAGTGYVTRIYKSGKCIGKVKTAKRLKVKVISSEKLTAKQITNRKNRYILVEKMNGTCINTRGDGRTSDGYYISYKSVKCHKKGAKYTTYLVYGNSSAEDDITYRADYRR